jgi:hypothetical protein
MVDSFTRIVSFKSSLSIATSLISYAMRLILCDMKMLSLLSTVTPVISEAVIEHEIISIKAK